MSETEALRGAGERIEQLLDDLSSLPDRRAGQWGEELVRLVTDLYGGGIERVIEIAGAPDAPRGLPLLDRLAEDELVSSILLVHDLHPHSLRQRVGAALDKLRSTMPLADVRLVHLDDETGSLKLRLALSDPAPAAAATAEERVREAITTAAPELETVEIDRLLPSTPVHFVRKAPAEAH